MADLMTHFALAYGLVRFSRFVRFRVIFYLGTILPDLLSRPFYILRPELYPYTVAVHTPLFMLVTCFAVAEFFQQEIRPQVRHFLLAGAGLHFLVDLFQRHLVNGYLWFYPFSWDSFEISWYWPHEPLRFIPLWIALICAVELFMWIRGKKMTAQGR